MPPPPQRTEVLIIGSGSAGIFAATWLARYNIPYTILERRSGPLEIGQADGVQCRTVEIYESFGVAEDVLRDAYHILEVAFWGPRENDHGHGGDEGSDLGIERKSRAPDREDGLTHCPHVILNQARMNAIMLGVLKGFRKEAGREGDGIEYGWGVKGVEVNGDEGYCCRVFGERGGVEGVWEARYVLGCDGAHSIVRKSLGYNMIGDTTDTVWGVMDIYPRTDFPDIRRKSTLHSHFGNLLIIPREGGSLVRFYIQLPAGSSPKDVKLSDLQSTARKIFHPYTLEIAETFWWSAYSIGQRLADHFHKDHRVFLTGDACHTHSPKAGQGMNVSLQDGYNIGWKLGHVLTNLSSPSLLETYVSERSKTAKELIDFDREFARMFSTKEERPGQFAEYFTKSGRYTAGLGVRYEDSVVVDGRGSNGDVAKGVVVGMRMPSAMVIRWCDCKAMQLAEALMSDGRWRVVVFGGDVEKEGARKRLDELSSSLGRMTKRFTPATEDMDSFIEPILVLRTKFVETEQEQIPEYFSPVTGKWKMRDIHKVYIDDEHYISGHGHAYEKYEVDPDVGAVIIVRPDQYVAKVTTMDDFDGIDAFFKGFLIERGITQHS